MRTNIKDAFGELISKLDTVEETTVMLNIGQQVSKLNTKKEKSKKKKPRIFKYCEGLSSYLTYV